MTDAAPRPSWADLLADEVRQLEARASGHDPELGLEAFCLLRAIRGYEARVRHLALRADYRAAGMLPAHGR